MIRSAPCREQLIRAPGKLSRAMTCKTPPVPGTKSVSQARQFAPFKQGVHHGRGHRRLAAGPHQFHRVDGHAFLGEDGDGVAAGRAVVVAVDQPAEAVLQAGTSQSVDPELDRLREAKRLVCVRATVIVDRAWTAERKKGRNEYCG